MTPKSNSKLVVFDVDGTLIPGNLGRRLIERLRSAGLLDRGAWLRVLAEYLAYRARLRDGTDALAAIYRQFTGIRVATFQSACEAVALDAAPSVFPGARERIEHHRGRGDRIVLASGSPELVVRALGDLLGVRECLGSRLQTVQGMICGVDERPLFGPDKLARVHAHAGDRPFELYTDDEGDWPLIAASTHTTLVNPSRRILQRLHSAALPGRVVFWHAPL